MRSRLANDTRLLTWQRTRVYAVPPSMIETATARRLAGDWAGACAAARVDVDLRPRAVGRTHGAEVAARVRADLRALAPELLRWHFPRVAPDGLLRPGLTVALARYDAPGARPLYLVARTPPAWADAGQRISLALWSRVGDAMHPHPHPRPSRRFRLDLHRHLWDAGRAGELRHRVRPERWAPGTRYAVHRWADEARILLAADGGDACGQVLVRLDNGHRLLLGPAPAAASTNAAAPASPPVAAISEDQVDAVAVDGHRPARRGRPGGAGLPVLPDAAVRVPADLELLRAGLITADRLHPLVAAALVPGHRPSPGGHPPAGPVEHIVECGGGRHRIRLVDGALAPVDHDPAELEREEILIALGGQPLPCLRAVDDAIRHPEALDDVRARLDHGDFAGALHLVEGLLGPQAVLRDGALRDELDTAALRRLTHGLFRAGMTGFGPPRHERDLRRRRTSRSRPRQAKHS